MYFLIVFLLHLTILVILKIPPLLNFSVHNLGSRLPVPPTFWPDYVSQPSGGNAVVTDNPAMLVVYNKSEFVNCIHVSCRLAVALLHMSSPFLDAIEGENLFWTSHYCAMGKSTMEEPCAVS